MVIIIIVVGVMIMRTRRSGRGGNRGEVWDLFGPRWLCAKPGKKAETHVVDIGLLRSYYPETLLLAIPDGIGKLG